MSMAPSRDVTRPASRASEARSQHESRRLFLIDRCLAIQFERVSDKPEVNPKPRSRPQSSLSTISGWWHRKISSETSKNKNQDPPEEDDKLSRVTTPTPTVETTPNGWVYDGGYILFQNFQEANGYCYWNTSLLEAIQQLEFIGHVTPATILVTAQESSLEVIRGAWARKVLRSPRSYAIVLVGDVDGCALQPITQCQFTPLPEALCWVIWELNLAERSTTLTDVSRALAQAFPDLMLPADKIIYDALGRLIRERKIYFTGKGYGVVTPDTFRKTAIVEKEKKAILLSNEEALALAHGTVEAYPQGNVVHKAIQTNLVDVVCRGNGGEKVLYPKSADEQSVTLRPRLQRQRSLRLFHGGSSKRLSWSEYRGGSLKLSPNKARKLMDELGYSTDWEEEYAEEIDTSTKIPKEKMSLLDRLFRRTPKKRGHLVSFNAQFPPPEWSESKLLHLHSIGVQTCFEDSPTEGSIIEPSHAVEESKSAILSSNQSECSSMTLSSPSPSQVSRRRITLARPPSTHSDACGHLRATPSNMKMETALLSSRSPATSLSSGLGRSFSPASAHSASSRPLRECTRSPPSPTQSTDSFYSSSLGPSASVIQSPVPSIDCKSALSDQLFHRNGPARSSYAGRFARPVAAASPEPTTGEFQRLAPRSMSYRLPRSTDLSLCSSPLSTPSKPATLNGASAASLALRRASEREKFFGSALSPLLQQARAPLEAPQLVKSPLSTTSTNKKYYETDLDFTIKVPKSNGSFRQEKTLTSPVNDSSKSRVINISVTKSESLNFVQANPGKENCEDRPVTVETPSTPQAVKNFDESFRTFPSLTELNINFKSITGQKILQGIASNSTDTLVEVNMREAEVRKSLTDLGFV